MKQDIKINYSQLDEILDSLSRYLSKCEALVGSVDAIDSLTALSAGEAVEALKESKQLVVGLIGQYRVQLKELFTLIEAYIADMTKEVQPLARAYTTRVDRYQMQTSINSFSRGSLIMRESVHVQSGMTFDGVPLSERYIQNARRLDEEIVSIQAKIDQTIRQFRTELLPKAVRYEEVDDEYREKAHEFYLKYISPEALQEDMRILELETDGDYVMGIWAWIADTFGSLGALVWNGLRYSSALEAGVPPPEEVEDFVAGTIDGAVSRINAVRNDIRLIYEDPVKEFSDMFDENPSYTLGYVTPDVVATVITIYQAYQAYQAVKAWIRLKAGIPVTMRPIELMDELALSGVKYNADDVIFVLERTDGTLYFLETGNANVGLEHIIIEHADQLMKLGISADEIPGLLYEVLQTEPVGFFPDTSGYARIFYYNGHYYRVAYGTNGFIVSFYPCKPPKKE